MKNKKIIFILLVMVALLSACSGNDAIEEALPTNTVTKEVLPTDTPVPLPTNTEIPPTATTVVVKNTPTPFPGEMVYPIEAMQNSIPWLSNSSLGRPLTFFFGFNLNQAPFRSSLVRKAFAAAIDREAIAKIARGLMFENVSPATSLVSPLILGRDLYGAVGVPFDVDQAKAYLAEAGYADLSSFPTVVVITSFADIEIAPAAYYIITDALVEMWEENLGIRVELKKYATVGEYYQFLQDFPTGYDLYRMLYASEFQGEGLDPSDIMELFTSDHYYNFANFAEGNYNRLMENARNANSAEERMGYYLEAERLLVEELAIVIPLFHATIP